METFTSYDGTRLAYRTLGRGPVLVCVPGGPGRAAEYLGSLGELSRHRTLVLLDNRGTGGSETPADLTTCRVDRLVLDVEALRAHLGLDRMDLLGHSAGGGVAFLYADAHPERLSHLALVCPSLAALGLPSDLGVEKVLASRSAEPWYGTALPAYHAMRAAASFAEAEPHRLAFEPLMYGRWTDEARAHAQADARQRSLPASDTFYAGYRPSPLRLDRVEAPVLVLAGELDLWPTAEGAAQAVPLFGEARLHVQPGAGHYPWLDDPSAFAAAVEAFLAS
ncbi:alpha/beta hydrolase [Nonomuraea sp. SMC257]|uniref:Alpha/beta hydrolase n=1 Tax=Nonomuraea montanisoli TaxID=2741721 RepID=A0A7Y6M8N4_9ACTN|nr:alpha/beta hydrolase [Nonomuraea montanisoli]NUW37925.1 alpha/beta hydrolase [Nonomuraea montanisoli]